MKRTRWKRTNATVELCEPSQPSSSESRYAVTISYQLEGELYLTDFISDQPLSEGSDVTVEYDSLDPRRNSLNHPRRERRAFLVALIFGALGLLLLLAIALVGL